MKHVLAVSAGLAAMVSAANVLFEEDFTNYRDHAPGTAVTEELSVSNDPIHRRRGSVGGAVTRDTMLFLKDKALPAGNAFDVLCAFELAETNSSFEAVFAGADGKSLAVPFSGSSGWQRAALKAADGKLVLWLTEKNRFAAVKTIPLASELKSVNFRFKAGGKVSLTGLVIRTPEPLPDTSAWNQYPAKASVTQPLGKSLVSDGKPLDLSGRSYSFVPGTTGVVGTVSVTWDSGTVQKFPVTVGDQLFGSPIASYAMPQLGLKPKEQWRGKDAVIDFGANGALARLFVRPALKNFASYRTVCDKGMDIVREWEKLPPASKHVTTVEMRETADAGLAQFWVDGSYAATAVPARGDKAATKVVKAELTLNKGVAYRVNEAARESADRTVELQLWARPKAKAFAGAKGSVAGGAKPLDSADVGLAHYAQCGFSLDADGYTMRTPLDGYPGEVHFRVPAAPYAKAEILFCLDDAADKVPYLVTRFAHYSMRFGTGCTEIEDAVLDLRGGMPAGVTKVGSVVRGGKDYPVYRAEIELPIGRCLDFAAGDFIDVEFAGPMEENLQQADNTQKPREDVSSAFNLFGVKLHKLNVLPELVQDSPGNVFTVDEKEKNTSVKLTALVDGAKGVLRFGDEERAYSLAKAGDVVTNTFDFSDAEVGWYETPVVIDDGTARVRHDLVYCVTPEAGRDATAEESPFGTWWFSVHGSPGDPAIGGPIVRKAGIRKISWNRALKAEDFRKYDCTSAGFIYAPKLGQFDEKTGKFKPGKVKRDGKMIEVDGEELAVANMKAEIVRKPFVDHIMVWHESAPQCGIPEEILGLAAPTNDVAREKKLAAYLNEVGRICRKHFPNLKIQIGNSNAGIGAPTVPLRGGAKAEYIDVLGMEIPSQTIAPERPHDFGFLGQNVTKAAAKKLSGRDIPSGGCYEFIYRAERDLGTDGEDVQARFHARDLLISLMNDYTLTAPGILFDCRNAYCNTLWGVGGILHRSPYVYPKKSYLAYAVMTKVMDGVKFVREIPTGSTTVYAAEFLRKDGRYATAFWCARGEADLVCDMKGELWTMYGRRMSVGGWFSDAEFTCSGAPVYVISSKPCKSVAIAARRFPADAALAAKGKSVAEFSAANVTVAPDPEVESKHHDFLPYLKPGVFTAKDVVDPEEGACLELTLDTAAKTAQPVTEFVTEYTTVRLRKPVEIPGVTALLGLRVKGDSNWGQVRFEIEDAKGEIFKGLSTGRSWGCDVYDWPGYTALSFDGWGDVYQYTDRNDFNLIISPGPRDEQWVSSTGGDKKIDFPVKLRAVTVCVNRYKPTILGFEKTEMPKILLKRAWSVPAKASR